MKQLSADRIPATLAWLGTFGALLTVAGVQYPGRTLFTLVFLTVTPVVCFAQLLPGIDPAARVVVSIAAGVTLVGAVAEIMLAAGWWSPRSGLIVVGVLCAALLALALTRRPRTPTPTTGPPPHRRQKPVETRDEAGDEEAWIYEP